MTFLYNVVIVLIWVFGDIHVLVDSINEHFGWTLHGVILYFAGLLILAAGDALLSSSRR